jgi:hypothetical protein
MRKSIVAIGLAALALGQLRMSNPAQAATGVSKASAVDFNGDGSSDYAAVRNNSGQVTYYVYSAAGASQGNWGLPTDTFVACDFDGDGKDDRASWRPGAPTVARFYIFQSATNTVREEAFGQTGDDPTVSADYDGDGKCDLAVYRDGLNVGDQSYFYYRGSLNNPGGNVTYVPWGVKGDVPTTGDYDGDGKWDVAVQRNGVFWIKTATGNTSVVPFGGDDFIIRGDYDGDAKSDLAVRRTVSGQQKYYIRQSSNGVVRYEQAWGSTGWSSTPGDYDGDGKTDLSAWDPSTGRFWTLRSSDGGTTIFKWGQTGDFPLAASQVK